MNAQEIIGRQKSLFSDDITFHEKELSEKIESSRFLVIGAAGSIGKAVSKELFKRNPKCLHAIDISENNLVELVRDLRSSIGYISGEFKTFVIDCGSPEYEALIKSTESYDYIINLSAMKHVRSERDAFSLMRMIKVNILNTVSTVRLAKASGVKKYFCVSTDKATNPVNMMGASKRIMEMFLAKEGQNIDISTARFANVAFSDGSLLHGFNNRLLNRQPITAPNDVRRFFVTPQESGELCLMSSILGRGMETFFPKTSDSLKLTKFSDIAVKYLEFQGYTPYECASEEEARSRAVELLQKKMWPVYFFESDTTGEKDFEEFYTTNEIVDMERFNSIGVISNNNQFDLEKLETFQAEIDVCLATLDYDRNRIICLFNETIPNFNHKETGKFLDNRM